jgi:hypothetical protein
MRVNQITAAEYSVRQSMLAIASVGKTAIFKISCSQDIFVRVPEVR